MKIVFAFSKTVKESKAFDKHLHSLNNRLRLKTTVHDQENLRSLLNQKSQQQLDRLIQRTSQHDNQFSDFLKKYQQKNRDLTILDLSHYARDFEKFKTMKGLSESQLLTIEQFRKRRMQQRANDYVQSAKRKKKGLKEQLDEQQNSVGGSKTLQIQTKFKKISKQQNSWRRRVQKRQKGVNKVGETRQGRLRIRDQFIMLVLDRDVTTQITRLNRLRHFRYLVFMGNSNGVVSYGRGQGNDVQTTLQNAITNCKKNLIALNLDPHHSFPKDIKTRFQNYQMNFESRSGFNPWGHPILSLMISLSGLTNLRFDVKHRSKNMYGLVNAFFKVVCQNQTPSQISERLGIKVYSRSWRTKLNEQEYEVLQ